MGEITFTFTVENYRTKLDEMADVMVKGLMAGPVVVTLGRETRTLDQNNKLWPMLTDIAKQVTLGGRKMPKEDWKEIITAAFRRQKIIPGLEGMFVVLPLRTSKMNKGEFAELIEYLYAFGAYPADYGAECETEHVLWSEPSLKVYEEYCG